MSEPTGPQSKAIYLRRRAMAAAGSALAVLLLIWAVGALLGGGSRATGSAAVDSMRADSSAPPSTSSVPASTTSSSSATSPPSSSAPASSSSLASSPANAAPLAPSTPTSVSPPPPPGPPQPCADAATKITASVARPSYRVGERPVLTLLVTNAGPLACTRDVSRPLRSLVVAPAGSPAGAGQPLWSSADCYTLAGPSEIVTLRPGQQVSYTVTWAGRTSAPGCPLARRTVPAGRYAVIGRLGKLASAPTPFTLTS